MFKNHAFMVSMVKKDKDGCTITPPVETQADVIAFASDAAKDVVQEGMKCIIVLMAVNTASKILINLTSK